LPTFNGATCKKASTPSFADWKTRRLPAGFLQLETLTLEATKADPLPQREPAAILAA
jgi:hypothetical protein